MENTATVRIDMQRLQMLNDRLCQTLEALNQVRLSAHNVSATTGWGLGAGVPFGLPYGQAYNLPYGQPFGHTYGTPIGYGMGSIYGQPFSGINAGVPSYIPNQWGWNNAPMFAGVPSTPFNWNGLPFFANSYANVAPNCAIGAGYGVTPTVGVNSIDRSHGAHFAQPAMW